MHNEYAKYTFQDEMCTLHNCSYVYILLSPPSTPRWLAALARAGHEGALPALLLRWLGGDVAPGPMVYFTEKRSEWEAEAGGSARVACARALQGKRS
jgi:hypothetical protein